jgi:predicted nuclease with TOPRIM domain
MPKKLQSDDDDLMKIFEHYAELRREHAEYEDNVHTLECDIASLQGRVDQLEELNKQLTEERDQFLERYYRLVTQFELMAARLIARAPASPMQSDTCALGPRSTNDMKYLRCRCLSPSAMAMAMAMG